MMQTYPLPHPYSGSASTSAPSVLLLLLLHLDSPSAPPLPCWRVTGCGAGPSLPLSRQMVPPQVALVSATLIAPLTVCVLKNNT